MSEELKTEENENVTREFKKFSKFFFPLPGRGEVNYITTHIVQYTNDIIKQINILKVKRTF